MKRNKKTLIIDDEIYKALKTMAVERDMFISQLLEEYIKEGLNHDENHKKFGKAEE